MTKVSSKTICRCARCFCVLGDETRMKILAFLFRNPKASASVSQIAKGLSLSLSTVSHSLAKLFAQGLVKREKRGRTVLYSPTTHLMNKLTRQALSL